MKKILIVLLTILIIFNVVYSPIRVNANPALRIVTGSVAEKVVIGIAEKAGQKYATKSAQEMAVKRWNLDLIEQYNRETAERRVLYENLVQRMNNPEPIPDRPGFGRIVLDGVMFATGADIIWDGYQAFKSASEGGTGVDVLGDSNKVMTSDRGGQLILYGPGAVPNILIHGSPSHAPKTGNLSIIYKEYATSGWEQFRWNYEYEWSTSFTLSSVLGYAKGYIGTGIIETESSVTQNVALPSDFVLPPVGVPDFLSEFIGQPGVNPSDLPFNFPEEVEIIVPLETEYKIGTNPVIEPKREVPIIPIPDPVPVSPEVPQPKYIPNPNYRPDLLPSIENPKYIPNPNYNPDKPPVADPTGKQHFDPVTGEDKGVQEVPIIDLQSFFLAIKTHFDNKYPIFTDLYNMYKIECEVCNNWKGLSTSGITIGGKKIEEIVIVDSSYVNAVAPKIKIWISGVIWFFLGLYLIKRMSTVWGSGK